MNRQLYMLGGIMDAMPRQEYGLGSFVKKAVKGVTKSVKKIASSDVGKAALTGAVLFGIPGMGTAGGIGGGLLGRASFGGAAPGIFGFGGIGGALAAGKAKFFPNAMQKAFGKNAMMGDPAQFFSAAKSAGEGIKLGTVGKFAALAGVSTFLTGTLGMSEEQAEEELARDPSKYLELYYRNLNPPTADTNSEEYEAQVRDFVTTNTSEYAEGGRIGYAAGSDELPEFNSESNIIPLSNDGEFKYTTPSEILPEFKYMSDGPVLPNDPTQPVNPFAPKPTGPVLPDRMASNEISIDKIEMLIKRGADNDLIKEFTGASDGVINQIRDAMERKNKAGGGIMNRAGYALGDTASQNAMQAAGIEGLPVRQNPKGVKELDLRNTGGFIQPVGIKEKEDDIPAMLSNNEFVFTADAVRGMGDGNVNVGAQRMYDMMKKLEAGGSV